MCLKVWNLKKKYGVIFFLGLWRSYSVKENISDSTINEIFRYRHKSLLFYVIGKDKCCALFKANFNIIILVHLRILIVANHFPRLMIVLKFSSLINNQLVRKLGPLTPNLSPPQDYPPPHFSLSSPC